MTRYQALRSIGCDPLAAGAIALMNWMRGVRDGEIRFMHMTIEFPTSQGEQSHDAR